MYARPSPVRTGTISSVRTSVGGRLEQLVRADRRARREAGDQLAEQRALAERCLLPRHPVRRQHSPGELIQLDRRRCGLRFCEQVLQVCWAVAGLGGAVDPGPAQLGHYRVPLARPGGQAGCAGGQVPGPSPQPRLLGGRAGAEGGLDLAAAGAELPPHGQRHPLDLGDAPLDGGPGDAEPGGELGAQLVLVEVAGGGGLPVQGAGVQR